MRASRITSLRLGAVLGVAFALLFVASARAQGSRADYERSAALRASSANKVYRSSVEAHWPPGGSTFWYEVQTGPRSREYVWVDAE
ncbi:MAG: hypothetical protein NTV51_07285, partial [Verrucomicrobia bacterium]|nr:hypothetical protein [Verrucomicrobiota bacterium]